jgi:hypothetical protein
MLGFVRTDNQSLVWCLGDPQRAVAAYHELLRRGKDATGAIRAGLHHQNPAVREGCCRPYRWPRRHRPGDGLRPGPEPGRPEEGSLVHARRHHLPTDHPTHAQETGRPWHDVVSWTAPDVARVDEPFTGPERGILDGLLDCQRVVIFPAPDSTMTWLRMLSDVVHGLL